MFRLHDIVKFGEESRRVLELRPDCVILIDPATETAWPERWLYEEAEDCVTSGAWIHERGKAPPVKLDKDLTPRQIQKRDSDWEILSPILSNVGIFEQEIRNVLMKDVAKLSGLRLPTIRKLLRRFFHRGMSKGALSPDWDKSGAPGKPREPGEKKRGAPVKYGERPGVNVTVEDARFFRLAVRATWRIDKRHSLRSAYRYYLSHYASISDPDDDREPILVERFAETGPPSFREFIYWVGKEDLEAMLEYRLTPRVYAVRRRPLTGTSTAEAFGPCSRFQIDATILRVYIRSRANRHHIVGRPVLYIVIDTFSRLIVGVHLSFESASWTNAMTSLANCVEDKVEFCRSHGIDIEPEDWPARQVCGSLLGDNGELKRKGITGLLENFNVHVQNAAPYRADWKGVVERRFGLIETTMGPYTPGFVEPDFLVRGARDYRGEAVLDLDDVWQNLIEIILYYNNKHELVGYPLQPGQVEDGVPSIPLELWRWGIANRTGSPREPDPEVFRFALLPHAEAIVTRQGLRFEGRFYVCEPAMQRRLSAKAADGRFKMPISHDERDVGRIYVHDASTRGFTIATLTDASVAHRGINACESHGITYKAKQISAQHRVADDLARAALEKRMDGRAQRAQAEFDAMPNPGSVPSQVRGLRDNRAREVARDRDAQVVAFRPAEPGDRPVGEAPATAEVIRLHPKETEGAAFSMTDLRRSLNANRTDTEQSRDDRAPAEDESND